MSVDRVVGIFKPLFQQWLQLAHVLEWQVERLKPWDGCLRKVVPIHLSHCQTNVALSVSWKIESFVKTFSVAHKPVWLYLPNLILLCLNSFANCSSSSRSTFSSAGRSSLGTPGGGNWGETEGGGWARGLPFKAPKAKWRPLVVVGTDEVVGRDLAVTSGGESEVKRGEDVSGGETPPGLAEVAIDVNGGGGGIGVKLDKANFTLLLPVEDCLLLSLRELVSSSGLLGIDLGVSGNAWGFTNSSFLFWSNFCNNFSWLVAWDTACETCDCNNIAEVCTLLGCCMSRKLCNCCCSVRCWWCSAICKACRSEAANPPPVFEVNTLAELTGGGVMVGLLPPRMTLLLLATAAAASWLCQRAFCAPKVWSWKETLRSSAELMLGNFLTLPGWVTFDRPAKQLGRLEPKLRLLWLVMFW